MQAGRAQVVALPAGDARGGEDQLARADAGPEPAAYAQAAADERRRLGVPALDQPEQRQVAAQEVQQQVAADALGQGDRFLQGRAALRR